MKIAIYGGSFNPAHIGHQLVAAHVLSTADVDELWFAPTYKHMLGKDLVDFEHRVQMVRIMAKMFGHRASVTRAEQRLARAPGFVGSLTVNLVRALKEEWPSDSFRLVIGSDLVDQVKTWDGWEEILDKAPPLVVHRAGYISDSGLPTRKLILPDISSTEVKAALSRLDDVSDIVPREVLNYIIEHNLYLPTTCAHPHPSWVRKMDAWICGECGIVMEEVR